MDDFDPSDRPRAAEDEYFRRRDAELLERARGAHRIALEHQALAEALGTPDTDAVDRLYASGMRASNAVLIEWLPAVDVAWLDGADEAERDELRRRFAADGRATDDSVALLDEWLMRRPSRGLFVAGRRALRHRLHGLDDDTRRAAIARIVAVCEAAGAAAGGFLGIGALSSDERRHIDFIRRDLERAH